MHEKDRALIQSIQDFFGGPKTNQRVTLSNSITRDTKRYYSTRSVQQSFRAFGYENPNLAMNP